MHLRVKKPTSYQYPLATSKWSMKEQTTKPLIEWITKVSKGEVKAIRCVNEDGFESITLISSRRLSPAQRSYWEGVVLGFILGIRPPATPES